MSQIAKAVYATLAFACRLVAVFARLFSRATALTNASFTFASSGKQTAEVFVVLTCRTGVWRCRTDESRVRDNRLTLSFR